MVIPDASHSTTDRPQRKKLFITTTAMWVTWNSNLGSSLPSNAATAIQVDLSIARGPLVWLNSLYMLGYAVGPLLFGPLSEHIGRRPVILYAYAGYMLCTMACALSDRFALLLAFRFLTGFVASAPNATVGGLLADAHPAQAERGRAMAYFTCAAVAGPLFGPLVSGFAQGHSWQLVFWVGFAIAGVGLPLPLLLPETFAPVLERRRARAAGEAVPGSSEKSLAAELRIVFTRPAVMMVREPIVLWTALYLALVYSILYLFFQAYPVIFQGTCPGFGRFCPLGSGFGEWLHRSRHILPGVYDLSPGMIGLGYLPSTLTQQTSPDCPHDMLTRRRSPRRYPAGPRRRLPLRRPARQIPSQRLPLGVRRNASPPAAGLHRRAPVRL